MLESILKEQLKGIFAGLNANYTFDISISPAHESRQELLDLLGDVASRPENSCLSHLNSRSPTVRK